MFVRPYIYSELAYGQFNGWSVASNGFDRKLYSIAPQVELSAGILNWLEFEMYVPETSWWQTAGDGQASANGNGVGDITAFLKWRFHVQQPDDWVPSLTETLFVSLPTSDWSGSAGTPPIPGGFAPLGRLPSTHFGAPELTEAILFARTSGRSASRGASTTRTAPPARTTASRSTTATSSSTAWRSSSSSMTPRASPTPWSWSGSTACPSGSMAKA